MAGAVVGARSKGVNMTRVLAVLGIVCLLSSGAMAQYFGRLLGQPWSDDDRATTYDHPMIEDGGHVNNDSSDTSVFAWDSFGRVRLIRQDQDSPIVGYRVLTIGLGTETPAFKASMDELDLTYGMYLGQVDGWKIGTMLGLGYSSTHPFVNTSGIFGIGHVTAEKAIDANDSFLLAVDYEANGALLPDIPLPGFAFVHRTKALTFLVGYPMSYVAWSPTPKWDVTAQYQVPYSWDLDGEYHVAKHFGFYSDAGNFFQGVVRSDGDITDRQFFQMSRVEAGIRLTFDPWIDSTIGIGYGFDQTISSGFDIRDMHGVSHLSNEPYLSFIVRGRF
jgi:hypothetical protein